MDNENGENAILSPYCPFCGRYKGVGSCNNKSCYIHYESESIGKTETRIRFVETDDDKESCVRCEEPVIVRCDICNRGFCRQHGKNSRSSKMLGMNHYIGTCSECGKFVCENCWIVNESQISCIERQYDDRFVSEVHSDKA